MTKWPWNASWSMVEFNTKRGPYQLQIGTCHLLLSSVQFSSVQSLSCVWLFATPWTVARQASLSITTSRSLLKLMSTESVMPSNHLILCRPLLLPASIFPSIRVFYNESVLRTRWPKYWSLSFSIGFSINGNWLLIPCFIFSPPKSFSKVTDCDFRVLLPWLC